MTNFLFVWQENILYVVMEKGDTDLASLLKVRPYLLVYLTGNSPVSMAHLGPLEYMNSICCRIYGGCSRRLGLDLLYNTYR